MLNIIWSFIVVSAVICALFLGNAEAVSSAFADSAADAVSLSRHYRPVVRADENCRAQRLNRTDSAIVRAAAAAAVSAA